MERVCSRSVYSCFVIWMGGLGGPSTSLNCLAASLILRLNGTVDTDLGSVAVGATLVVRDEEGISRLEKLCPPLTRALFVPTLVKRPDPLAAGYMSGLARA